MKRNILIAIFFILFLFAALLTYAFLFEKNSDFAIGYAQIISGVIAGVLTMLGVIVTLIDQHNKTVEERRRSIKPFVVLGKESNDIQVTIPVTIDDGFLISDENYCKEVSLFVDREEAETMAIIKRFPCYCHIKRFTIHNADFSECILRGIEYEGQAYLFKQVSLLRKNTTYKIDLQKYFFGLEKPDTIPFVSLLLEDMEENTYDLVLSLMPCFIVDNDGFEIKIYNTALADSTEALENTFYVFDYEVEIADVSYNTKF